MGDQGIGGGDNGSKGKNRAKPPPQQRLSAAQKRELVELWATFQTLGHIRKHFLDRHNLRLADSTLLSYDASRRGCSLGKKLRAYFDEVRREYVTNASAVAIAHQAHRLRRYEEIADSALKSKDFSSALKAMELAAKEMGGVLEGKTTVEHRGAVAHVHGSVEDMRQELAMRLRQVVEGGTLLPAPEEEDVATEGDTEGAAP